MEWQPDREPLQKNSITAWNTSHFRCRLIFPGLVSDDWAFDKVSDPVTLFNSLSEFQDRTGREASFKFEVARDLFEQTLKPGQIKTFWNDSEQYWLPFIEKAESDFIWSRKPRPIEKKRGFVHAFDKRSMFLSAARSVFVGVGPYEHLQDLELNRLVLKHKKLAGLIEFDSPVKFRDPMLAEMFGGETQFYWPMVELLLQNEAQTFPKIKNAWIWTEPVRLFEKFSADLIKAIQQGRADMLDEFGEPIESVRVAVDAMKSLYTGFFGWLGRRSSRDVSNYKSELFRPDWRGHIVAMAKANLIRNMLQVRTWTGGDYEPFGVYHDCLMYFAENENPVLDFDKSDLLYQNKFTHEWTLPAKQVLKHLKTDDSLVSLDMLGKTEGSKYA